jgi:hypothetical protein
MKLLIMQFSPVSPHFIPTNLLMQFFMRKWLLYKRYTIICEAHIGKFYYYVEKFAMARENMFLRMILGLNRTSDIFLQQVFPSYFTAGMPHTAKQKSALVYQLEVIRCVRSCEMCPRTLWQIGTKVSIFIVPCL